MGNDQGTEDPYLQEYRIELDSVAQRVGAEGFWKYIMYRIKLLAKGLDYTNVILKPASATLYPTEITNFLLELQAHIDNITKKAWDKMKTKLTKVPELIDVQAKRHEIHEKLSPVVADDPDMQTLVE